VLNLSPLKLLIVLVVALLVAGPDKLPQIARQLGGAWKAFRTFSSKLEDDIRSSVPDLPSTGDIARFARSPVALLDKLADLDEKGLKPDPGSPSAVEPTEGLLPDPTAPEAEETPPEATQRPRPVVPPSAGFDPSLN
jgi:TatA/E family protein of Tat protein translocase